MLFIHILQLPLLSCVVLPLQPVSKISYDFYKTYVLVYLLEIPNLSLHGLLEAPIFSLAPPLEL